MGLSFVPHVVKEEVQSKLTEYDKTDTYRKLAFAAFYFIAVYFTFFVKHDHVISNEL